jgi:hypothetical protein
VLHTHFQKLAEEKLWGDEYDKKYKWEKWRVTIKHKNLKIILINNISTPINFSKINRSTRMNKTLMKIHKNFKIAQTKIRGYSDRFPV